MQRSSQSALLSLINKEGPALPSPLGHQVRTGLRGMRWGVAAGHQEALVTRASLPLPPTTLPGVCNKDLPANPYKKAAAWPRHLSSGGSDCSPSMSCFTPGPRENLSWLFLQLLCPASLALHLHHPGSHCLVVIWLPIVSCLRSWLRTGPSVSCPFQEQSLLCPVG